MVQKLFVVTLLASAIAVAAPQHLQQFPGPSPHLQQMPGPIPHLQQFPGPSPNPHLQ
jgi:hypothetical protein